MAVLPQGRRQGRAGQGTWQGRAGQSAGQGTWQGRAEHWAGQGRALGRARQGTWQGTWQGRAGQGRAGQGRAGHDLDTVVAPASLAGSISDVSLQLGRQLWQVQEDVLCGSQDRCSACQLALGVDQVCRVQ